MQNIWFESWESIVRTICLTFLGYCAMIVFLRVSGKRTLSKMNAFDFIITIALGSCLATVSLNKKVSLADGATAFLLFIFLQFMITWLSVRIKKFKSLITSGPVLIFYRGSFLNHVMKKERVTVEEVFSIGRQKGFASLDKIEMIILETTGELTIVEKLQEGRIQAIEDVKIKSN
jgi:uncharacterized membrane protein YcaP (DUF421 family)